MPADGPLRLDAGNIKGAKEAKGILLNLPDDLADDLPNEARRIARGVAADVQAAFPGTIAFFHIPWSQGFGKLQPQIVKYDVAAKADVSDDLSDVASVQGNDRQVPLFRIVVDGKNAVYADMGKIAVQEDAKRKSGIRFLSVEVGSPSRFAWPVAERSKSRAEAMLSRASKKYVKKYTADLAEPSE